MWTCQSGSYKLFFKMQWKYFDLDESKINRAVFAAQKDTSKAKA